MGISSLSGVSLAERWMEDEIFGVTGSISFCSNVVSNGAVELKYRNGIDMCVQKG